ncbi:MAG: signal peptidase I, partial [Planctomycetes bacterium]|nr:signal peptidase I [Planctomycetota bacterium]
MADPGTATTTTTARSGGWRTIIDLGVSLAILVALFRAFLAGGYMIETGSMAPCLLGRHRPAVCPSCQFPFAVEATGAAFQATCPNCGTGSIPTKDLAENDGDHLLVHRLLYELRAPRRWEVIVF